MIGAHPWWWAALPVLLLPLWWHRQRKNRVAASILATAKFLPPSEAQRQRVWQWVDRLLLLLRCMLLATAIAWLADPVVPWRGDAVIETAGLDPAWAARQVADAGFGAAHRITRAPDDLLPWLAQHEREWRDDARLLVLGDIPMGAHPPRFAHKVALRTRAIPAVKTEHRIAIVSARPGPWRTFFAALDGPRHYIIDALPEASTELVIWDVRQAPPAQMHAPLWWVTDSNAFPELVGAAVIDGVRYADSARGRLWSSPAWPPKDADSARILFEQWQQLHVRPLAYPAPSQAAAQVPAMSSAGSMTADGIAGGTGILSQTLAAALLLLFALERAVTHARRR